MIYLQDTNNSLVLCADELKTKPENIGQLDNTPDIDKHRRSAIMRKQKEMTEITNQIDGEFTDIQLVERIIRLRHDKASTKAALKRTIEDLAQRLVNKDITEMQVGDDLVVISPKMLTEYKQETLKSLRSCVTDDQIWTTFKQLPSGKQLQAISDLGGASAKAVILSAKHKIETDTMQLKIKKPRKGKR